MPQSWFSKIVFLEMYFSLGCRWPFLKYLVRIIIILWICFLIKMLCSLHKGCQFSLDYFVLSEFLTVDPWTTSVWTVHVHSYQYYFPINTEGPWCLLVVCLQVLLIDSNNLGSKTYFHIPSCSFSIVDQKYCFQSEVCWICGSEDLVVESKVIVLFWTAQDGWWCP